jgi:hypothetical protein
MARVVDRAVTRIQRDSEITAAPAVPQREGLGKDALQKVQFEAFERVHGGAQQGSGASFVRYIRRQRGDIGHPAAIELAINAYLCKVLGVGVTGETKGNSTFAIRKAAHHLDRTPDYGSTPARVVERSTNVPRLGSGSSVGDKLRNVQFIDNPQATTGENSAIGRRSRRDSAAPPRRPRS